MENTNPWSLLRGTASEQEQGLRIVRQWHAQDPSESHIMELGVAYLWLRRYQSAWEHFHGVIQANPRSGDSDYGMAGVAKWCLGEPNEAVTLWRAGLKAKYARANGLGVRMPMLLFFASVVRPDTCERSSAEQLLLKKTKDIRIKTWPGPIAKMLLGQNNENDLQIQCKGNNDSDTRNRHWLVDFYKIVLQHNQSNISVLKEAMRKLTDTSLPEWSDENIFLTRFWSEEFFLARYEAND